MVAARARYGSGVRWRLASLTLLGLLMIGCPRQPDAPPPGMGTPCDSTEECNAGATCGLLRICVEGYCEDEASLVRPCPGEGEPIGP